MQADNFLANSLPVVGIADCHVPRQNFNRLRRRFDVFVFGKRKLNVGNLPVAQKSEAARIRYQRIARYAGFLVIWRAESAVDDNRLAASFNRTFALAHANGYMSVDDMPACVKPEFRQNRVANLHIVNQRIIRGGRFALQIFVVVELLPPGGRFMRRLAVKLPLFSKVCPKDPHTVAQN